MSKTNIITWLKLHYHLTWGLKGFFPFSICLSIDVTGDVVKGEKKMVLFMKLSGKFNLDLRTQKEIRVWTTQNRLMKSMTKVKDPFTL